MTSRNGIFAEVHGAQNGRDNESLAQTATLQKALQSLQTVDDHPDLQANRNTLFWVEILPKTVMRRARTGGNMTSHVIIIYDADTYYVLRPMQVFLLSIQ